MSSGNPLFALVHSLGPAEKRYFRRFAERHAPGGRNQYLDLFDLIVSQPGHSPAQVQAAYPHPHYASDQNYLQRLLFKALRAYRNDHHPEDQVRNLQADLELLADKRQFGLCRRLLGKAHKICHRYDLFPQRLQLLQYERRYLKSIHQDQLGQRLATVSQQIRTVLHHLSVEQDYVELTDRLLVLLRTHTRLAPEAARQEARDALTSPLLSNPQQPSSFQSQSYYHLARAYARQILGQEQEFLHELRGNIRHWTQHPHRIQREPYQFQRALSNLLAASIQAGEIKEVPALLDQMTRLPRKDHLAKAEHFSNFAFFQLLYLLETRQFDRALERAPRIASDLQRFQPVIPASRAITLHFNLSLVYLFSRQPSTAIRKLTDVLQFPGEVRRDLRRSAHFLRLALHLQLGNHDLSNHLLRQAKQAAPQASPLEKALLRFFQDRFQDPQPHLPRYCRAFLHQWPHTHDQTHSELLHWMEMTAGEGDW